MKMGTGIFLGILLILIGLGLVIKVVFNVEFPIFKFIIAFFFIYIGLRILFGSYDIFHFRTGKNDVIFSETTFKVINDEKKEYNVIFGKAVFDFRKVELKDKPVVVIINTIFGGSEVLIDKDIPLRIKIDAVFAGTTMPGGNSAVFGSSNFKSDNFDENAGYLYIKVDVVFGGVEIRYK